MQSVESEDKGDIDEIFLSILTENTASDPMDEPVKWTHLTKANKESDAVLGKKHRKRTEISKDQPSIEISCTIGGNNNIFSNCRPIRTTNGEKSIPPSGGITFRTARGKGSLK